MAATRPGKGLGLILAAFALLLFAPAAGAYEIPARLNEVARVYSLGVGEVRCPTEGEWQAYYGSAFAWGSTNLREDYTTLAPFICDGALAIGTTPVPLWQQAAGVWVLVHEAFHLRHWRFRRDEAKVACQAIVYFRDAAMRLGASEAQAEELYPTLSRCTSANPSSSPGIATRGVSHPSGFLLCRDPVSTSPETTGGMSRNVGIREGA